MIYDPKLTGKLIQLERKKRNWTLEKLGKKLNITGKQVSKYEKGDPMPPIDMLIKLCDVFECEMGYLLGEESYAEGTKLQTAILEHLHLTSASADMIKRITGTDRRAITFGCKSDEYTRVLNGLLSSPQFAYFVESLSYLDEQIAKREQIFKSLEDRFGQELLDKAYECHQSTVDYEHDPDGVLPDLPVLEAVQALENAIDEAYNLEYPIKVARYELNESFQNLVEELYPRK